MAPNQRSTYLAYAALIVSPIFFSTNVVFGRAGTDIAPFLMAFIRWGTVGLFLTLLCRNHWTQMLATVRAQWPLLLLLGFLGMFICGGFVYVALRETTATNGTLIYTLPPVIIILIEHFWRKRPLQLRESLGVSMAIIGVGIIVAKGSLKNLVNLDFNDGDLLFLAAATSWAVYSVILKSKVFADLDTLPLFAIIALFGALILSPFALWEIVQGQDLPTTSRHWLIIAGVTLFAGLIAYSTYQYGVKILGPSIAGIFMYLMPIFGICFAWMFLGENIQDFHFAGILAVLTGVILATFPVHNFRKSRVSKNIEV